MRHKKAGRRLGRSTGHRRALYRNLTLQLFEHEVIHTTEAKAKSVRPQAEKLITLAKRGRQGNRVHAQRIAMARLNNKEIVRKLFDDLAPRFEDRAGGYTRITKLGPRKGDGAEIVQFELVEE
ncbi:MAG: 50S ribosomal protein L17 [Chloroflexota bacterium]|nr:50S ribosomal protein L17 [Chloroflexota bacterium]